MNEAVKKGKEQGKAEAQQDIKKILAEEESKRKKIILNAEREKQVSQ